jgi:hypothetical protein
MAYFKTKNNILGKFCRVLQGKMLVFFTAIWSFYGSLVYFVAVGNILCLFGIFFPILVCFTKKKSGNPVSHWQNHLFE